MNSTNDIRPIKGPILIPDEWNLWLWAGLIVFALAALLFWWYWRKRRPSQTPVHAAPPMPAHERALHKLEAAWALVHEPKPFVFMVSEALRIYLEERFQLHAPERTTEEFLAELQHSPTLSFEQKTALSDFLERCDLVKFAQYHPERSELQGLHAAAVQLVMETKPEPERAPAPEEPESTKRS